MSTREREREYARRRHEKWLARQEALRAARRQRRTAAATALGFVLLVAVLWVVVDPGGDAAPAAASPSPSETARSVPDPALAEGRTWTASLLTSAGDLTLELDGAAAPQAVASFVTLAHEGFFDGTTCHRLTTADADGISILQCGDPTATGTGGPGYSFGPIENAPADGVYPAGTVAMARQQGDGSSMGSQFFLVYADTTLPADAAGGYTVFGRITEGLDVLESVAAAGVVEGTQTPATTVMIQGVETQ